MHLDFCILSPFEGNLILLYVGKFNGKERDQMWQKNEMAACKMTCGCPVAIPLSGDDGNWDSNTSAADPEKRGELGK